ncbi:RidA family protein [Pseudoclavibacter soli]|uniref:RidA family protein n=1 Tax=Pseudoclavibacter soli TaxID=452623 RepID=UPI0004197C27|nr:RidA family protein [Pseudoclavibacter soli]
MSEQVLPSARLHELGIELPPVAVPVAAYTPALRVDDLVHTSGQLPFVDGALAHTGKVGAEVTAEVAADLARTAALNAVAAAAAAAGGVDHIVRVVKVVGFVASDPAFTAQPAVINGASEVLQQIFGDAGVHARSAVGVAVLPLDSPVEVEITVQVA